MCGYFMSRMGKYGPDAWTWLAYWKIEILVMAREIASGSLKLKSLMLFVAFEYASVTWPWNA